MQFARRVGDRFEGSASSRVAASRHRVSDSAHADRVSHTTGRSYRSRRPRQPATLRLRRPSARGGCRKDKLRSRTTRNPPPASCLLRIPVQPVGRARFGPVPASFAPCGHIAPLPRPDLGHGIAIPACTARSGVPDAAAAADSGAAGGGAVASPREGDAGGALPIDSFRPRARTARAAAWITPERRFIARVVRPGVPQPKGVHGDANRWSAAKCAPR
jgi:hypothetical protein